jgi:hypothetical protein
MAEFLNEHGEYFLAFIALTLLFGPLIHFLLIGWKNRSREITANFSPDNIKVYFKIFFFAEYGNSENPQKDFEDLYHKRFGRKCFFIPIVCLFFVSAFLFVIVSQTVFIWLDEDLSVSSEFPPIAVATIAGAYMWVLNDFIKRTQRRDVVPANVFCASFRLIIAVPIGFAIASLFKEEIGVAIAVFLGAFPTRTLFTIFRREVTARLRLSNSENKPIRELKDLQGIEIEQVERFEDEGIMTILQLAYCDPIDLTNRTNYSFSYVVDCCSQALAWLYFEQNLVKMRQYGLRGGQEISSLILELDSDDNEEQERATRCRDIVAAELGMAPEVFERTLREVAADPYTDFLCEIWCHR